MLAVRNRVVPNRASALAGRGSPSATFAGYPVTVGIFEAGGSGGFPGSWLPSAITPAAIRTRAAHRMPLAPRLAVAASAVTWGETMPAGRARPVATETAARAVDADSATGTRAAAPDAAAS